MAVRANVCRGYYEPDLTTAQHAPTAPRVGADRFPVRVSPDGRHFVYANGEPAFTLGNTAYNLIACYRRSPDAPDYENDWVLRVMVVS